MCDFSLDSTSISLGLSRRLQIKECCRRAAEVIRNMKLLLLLKVYWVIKAVS